MSLKVPPAFVFLFHAFLVWMAARYLPIADIEIPGKRVIVQAFGAAGVAIAILAMGLFRKAGTTVDPLIPDKASKIVDGGIYRYTRNPMYLGLVLILAAWIVWKGNLVGVIFLATCIWYLTTFQIKPEEQALTRKFGKEYLNYRNKVRRWL